MRGKPPLVQVAMTRLPVEVENCETVAQAEALMAKHEIRHIPVMSGSHLQGIVSQRDLLGVRLTRGEEAQDLPLSDVCRTDVLTVSPVSPVDEVAEKMLRRKAGSAVVVDGGYVVGIFTASDALRVLRDLFRRPAREA